MLLVTIIHRVNLLYHKLNINLIIKKNWWEINGTNYTLKMCLIKVSFRHLNIKIKLTLFFDTFFSDITYLSKKNFQNGQKCDV